MLYDSAHVFGGRFSSAPGDDAAEVSMTIKVGAAACFDLLRKQYLVLLTEQARCAVDDVHSRKAPCVHFCVASNRFEIP